MNDVLSLAVTLFVCVLVPVYWKAYGPKNFLWFSDVGLLLTVPALWLQSSLLNSMLVIGILPFEFVWSIDFIFLACLGSSLIGGTDYMKDKSVPLSLRLLSLFHLFLPIIWVWNLYRWGYDPRALMYQVGLFTAILTSTYLLTTPADNINWLYEPAKRNWKLTARLWFIIVLVAVPLFVYLPMHLIMRVAF